MNGEAGLSCPRCAATRDIYRYCMNCGLDYTAVAAVAERAEQAELPALTIQPVLPPPASGEQSPVVGGRSAPVILGLIVAAVFVLVLIGAAVVSLIRADNDPSDAKASDSSAPDASSSPGTTKAACWNGAEVTALSQCSEPTGTAGLAWVFPSFDQQDCRERRAEPAKWTCTVETADGGEVQITYREHKGVKRPLRAFTAKYGEANRTTVLSTREDIERYVWTSPTTNDKGVWALSSMYAEHPWSVTIKGLSADDVEAALNGTVEFRNPRRLSGYPAEG